MDMHLRSLAGRVKRKVKGPKYKPPPRNGDKYKILGKWMYLDDLDSSRLTRFGIYQPEQTKLIKKLVKKKHTVIDIGANIGYFTLIMAQQAKQVHAFEPEARNFEILKKNVELNGFSNVKLHNLAVAETNGKTTLHLCDIGRGMHRIYPSQWCKEGTTNVQTVRIDDIIEEADFIKIDIEGAELGALKGMTKLLKKRKSNIIMEFHPPSIEEYGAKPRNIYDFMTSLGYEIKGSLRDSLSFEELEKIAIENAGTNILCTPMSYKNKGENLFSKILIPKLQS
jgi:FkbM family methyltransferase